ncbi:MAG: hypothetical protein E7Z91_01130 [Cyanobacteria bacterium SIG30]|nr:hypothetical protein [Cyanobacteria bacterium SIG30]
MNNFNIFSIAGKIIQNALFQNEGIKAQQNKAFEQNINQQTNNFNLTQTNQLLTNYLAELKVKNMEFAQTNAYMKDILNIPQDFKNLVSQLATLTQNQQNTQNNSINLLILQNLLIDNQKEASQKIFQQMADMARKNIDTSQMKELMAIVLGNNPTSQQTDIIKNILLLYIPFLPITTKAENLDWEIKEKKEEGKNNNKEEVVEILISTINYQNIKISLYCNGASHVDVIINSINDFPKETLSRFIKMFAKENNFTVKIAFEDIKQTENTNLKQSVKIMSGLVLNSCVMLILQSTINFVLNMDLKKED